MTDGTDDTGGSSGTTPTRVDDPDRLAKVALRQFDECGAFLDYVHTEGAERVGAYGFDNQQYWLGMDDVMVMEAATPDAAEAEGGDVALGPTVVQRRARARRDLGAGGTDEPLRVTVARTSRRRTSRSKVSTSPTSSRPTAPASSH